MTTADELSGSVPRAAWQEVVVSGQSFWARQPLPMAAMYLGIQSKRGVTNEERLTGAVSYLEHVLHPESFEWLMYLSVSDEEFDIAEVSELTREVTERFSARPFYVDTSLCGVIYQSWAQVRGRLVLKGIADPLRQLPSLFALIDVVELMILEGMEKEEDRDRYWLRTYSPPPGYGKTGSTPRGWDRESEMAAFDALGD